MPYGGELRMAKYIMGVLADITAYLERTSG